MCEAVNSIGGQKKIVQSDPVHIEVRGAPQVLRYSVAREVEAVSGRDVRLEMEVCSDPAPTMTAWDLGSNLRVEAGGQVRKDMYELLGVVQGQNQICTAKLRRKKIV